MHSGSPGGGQWGNVDRSLGKAWIQDSALTLRTVWCCRGLYDGRTDCELFYRACGQLYKNHPHMGVISLRYLVKFLSCRSVKDNAQ
ncbi:hypothetical protein EDD17DRAFT_192118, partial [Pisolithus thermaeus]